MHEELQGWDDRRAFFLTFLKATPPFLAPHIKDVIVEMSLRESLHLSTFYDSSI